MAVDTENAEFIFDYKNRNSIKVDEGFKEQSIQAIEYLNKLDNVEKVFEDKKAFNALCFICQTIIYVKNKEVNEILDSRSFGGLLVTILKYFYTINNDLIFKQDENSSMIVLRNNHQTFATLDQNKSTIFLFLLVGTNFYVYVSMKFCNEFLRSGGLKYYIKFLKDKKFMEKNIDWSTKCLEFDINPVKQIILTMWGLSRTCEEDKKIWIELDSIKILLKMSKKKIELKSSSYNSIINIADDYQLENLPEMSNVKLFVVERVEKMVECFNNRNLDRRTIQISIKGVIIDCLNLCYWFKENKENLVWDIIFQLKLLYKLSINKKMRKELYFENNLIKTLQTILLKGNYFEIYFVLEIIAQLTFDEKISSDLKKSNDFKCILEKLDQQNINEIKSEDEKKAFQGVKEFIQRIYWNLEDKVIETENTEKAQHIMISYNSASRPLCLQIKEYLEDKCKQKVWIDVNDIYGESLDSMAKAVECASCVLMCVTEKYRQSVDCQGEAEYAFKRKKTIIPIIMQSGYEPQGWLDFIIGTKIYVSLIFLSSLIIN